VGGVVEQKRAGLVLPIFFGNDRQL
jgi:hypothetical protein